jgi:hypothetical protein
LTEDNRASLRRRTLKGGRIVLNNGNSTISCTVRNLSETGALLRVPSILGIPDGFDLLFDDGTRYTCTVVRRSGTELGVQFA